MARLFGKVMTGTVAALFLALGIFLVVSSLRRQSTSRTRGRVWIGLTAGLGAILAGIFVFVAAMVGMRRGARAVPRSPVVWIDEGIGIGLLG